VLSSHARIRSTRQDPRAVGFLGPPDQAPGRLTRSSKVTAKLPPNYTTRANGTSHCVPTVYTVAATGVHPASAYLHRTTEGRDGPRRLGRRA
jgi:hypothetical protein